MGEAPVPNAVEDPMTTILALVWAEEKTGIIMPSAIMYRELRIAKGLGLFETEGGTNKYMDVVRSPNAVAIMR